MEAEFLMVQTVLLIAHTAIALLIIALVLLQRGKGAEAGTGFGAGASGTVFGARGSANFLSRSTAVLATLFFASSLGLAYLAGQGPQRAESLLERSAEEQTDPIALPTAPDSDELELPALPEVETEPPTESELPAAEE